MQNVNVKNCLLALLCALVFLGCEQVEDTFQAGKPLFSVVDTSHSTITFSNTIQESDTLNYYNFPYIYMGGGVAIGDFNNDNLSDVYLTGNMVENKLYLNKGELIFEDVTEFAGVQGDKRWYTGVTLVDINSDGWLDIYLSVSGKNTDSKNQLFVNDKDGTFTERAAEYGIDDASASIQSTFFDYDKDGDLDLFVANYPLVPLTQGNRFYATMIKQNKPEFSGHMYRNEGNGSFKDVTSDSGLQNFGLTLGLVSMDFNDDGWQDLYLSNDFNVPDYFYLNNGDGTFTEILKRATSHTSMFGMGIDAADFNNDGLIDLVQADMTPEDYKRSKVNMASMSPKSFWQAIDFGFHYQYMQNSLQVNNGMENGGIPFMSEISRMAGIATTDWSWSVLFADLDNDGWKDLYITNGMKRDVNDNDLNQKTGATTFQAAFKRIDIDKYPSEPLENYVFQNKRDFTFKKVTTDWGLDYKGFSNGMAYGDLDNDGDLDLIINNIDKEISLYENLLDQRESHFLRIKLSGSVHNPMGIGAKVWLGSEEGKYMQVQELAVTRGFQSGMEPILHFGLGNNTSPKKLKIIWPDLKQQEMPVTHFNRVIELNYANAKHPDNTDAATGWQREAPAFFFNITDEVALPFEHIEDFYDDYIKEPLLPHKYSTLGPGLATGDANNDGLQDVFIGNAANAKGALLVQDDKGLFTRLPGPWESDSDQEDTGALFLDIDNDGDLDLYVVSGGHDPMEPGTYYQDRLYVKTTTGYEKTLKALPKMPVAGQAVAATDFDHDGDMDLFIGGRNVPGEYPQAPMSYLLENKGGKDHALVFQDVSDAIATGLGNIGMVTGALWTDLNSDGWEDLVVAGEWMPIVIFKNNKGVFEDVTEAWGFREKTGWWYSISTLDVDNDGDNDLVAGNLGHNYKYKASDEKPFEVFANDFDENGRTDIVLSVHKDGKLLPLRGRECSSQQIPAIANKFKTFRDFAAADLADIYGESMLGKSLHYKATTFTHYWIENKGNDKFEWHSLPQRSQISPINSIVPIDYNLDGYLDLVVMGGIYDAEVETPRADASVGLLLKNNMGKGFEEVNPMESGILIRGNIKNASKFKGNDGEMYILFVRNNGKPQLIQLLNIKTAID
ncbi:VCBS repeat-containing protein [Fulvivirgaceae bacterium BMA10]|uniref:VCBS repeat-containing protein n=1 Tax=Splendidivirga corallicola TaxID=3051826 RepID=A0ABT8KN66_9BACT|nr:VCBS repeat-containing protein [Fulvivirgaceae bacterium BMA10]